MLSLWRQYRPTIPKFVMTNCTSMSKVVTLNLESNTKFRIDDFEHALWERWVIGRTSQRFRTRPFILPSVVFFTNEGSKNLFHESAPCFPNGLAYHQFQTSNESALSYKTLYSIIRNLLYPQHEFDSNSRCFFRKVNTGKSKYTVALVGYTITSIGKGKLPGEAQ